MATKFRTLFLAFPLWQPLTDFWSKTTKWSWVGKYLFFGWLFNDYEVTFIPINKELEEEESTVIPKQIIADVIRRSSHRVILPVCLCRIGCRCEHHSMGIGCIFLGEATKQMDPSLGKPVSVEEALEHLDKAVDEGLIPQIGKVDPDAFWSGVKMKDWDRFLTLCFCCTCCCIAMRNMPRWSEDMKDRMRSLDGLKIEVTDKCNGCGKCIKKCFTRSIELNGDQVGINHDTCKGCGICADKCPQDAIDISVSDGDKMLEVIYKRIESYGDII